MHIIKYIIIITVCFCMALFLYQTDFKSVFGTLSAVGFSALLVFPLTAFAYYLGTLSWQVLLAESSQKINTFRLFFIRQVGETVGLFNPTSIVGGDLTKVYYLQKYQISERSAANSVVSSRMTMILSQILLATIALIWLLYQTGETDWMTNTRTALYILLFVLCTVQIGLFYWIYRPHYIAPSLVQEMTATGRIDRLKSKMLLILSDLKITVRADRKAFILSYSLALLHWVVGSLEFFLILSFLGIDIAIMQAVLMDMGVILIKSVGAFIPGQIGVEEFGNKIVLAAIGVQSGVIWLSISLLRRFRQLVWALVGCIAYFFFSKQIKPPYVVHE